MKLRIVTLLIAGTLVAATSGIAHATNVAANTGHAVNYPHESCMRSSFDLSGVGAVQNTCGAAGTYELWAVELPVNSAGSKTVTVRGSRSMVFATSCIARGLTQDGAVSGQSGWVSFGTSGASGDNYTITLTGASVPANGRLQVQCNVASNLNLYTIHYDM